MTATPAVVDGTVYVGDWSGRFYAIDLETGELDWSFTAEPHAGSTPGRSWARPPWPTSRHPHGLRPERRDLYALRADDGEVRWERDLGRPDGDDDPTEIELAAVADGLVIVGTDVHNSPDGTAAGVVALDAATGARRWETTTAPTSGAGATGAGCGDVGGRPASTSSVASCSSAPNCTTAEGWGGASEALLALDLDTGDRVWTYQPTSRTSTTSTSPGRPTCSRSTGGPSSASATRTPPTTSSTARRRPRLADEGRGARGRRGGRELLVRRVHRADGLRGRHGRRRHRGRRLAHLHALDAETGDILWQQGEAGPTFAALEVNGVVFLGGTDYTLRAVDLQTGDVLWSQEMQGAVSGGAVAAGDDVWR